MDNLNLVDKTAMKTAFNHTMRNALKQFSDTISETIFEATDIEGVVHGFNKKLNKLSIPVSKELHLDDRYLFSHTGDGRGD